MDSLPFRIKIGVTGHRNNLPPVELLKEKIRTVIGYEDWKSQGIISPNSIFSLFDEGSISELKKSKETFIVFTILSPLAEGADRIVAETVLEIEGSSLEVILPLTKEDYLEDFITIQSKTEFEELLSKAYHPHILRTHNLEDQYKPGEIHKKRNQAYLNAGKYVVDHSDVLIAIWDGEDVKGTGGTKDIIDYANNNNRPVIIISSINPNEITVYKNSGLKAGTIEQLNYFNTYNLPEGHEKLYVENVYKDYLLEENTLQEKNEARMEMLNFLKIHLFPYYVKASTIAKKYQLIFKRSGLLAYWFSSLAVFILVVSVVFGKFNLLAFILEFFLLLGILIIISRAHRIRAHTKWLENRFLAERLRIAPYFFISGQEMIEVTVSPYQENKNEPGQWMIHAFTEIWKQTNNKWYLKNGRNKTHMPFGVELIEYINKSWIEGQIKYHESNLKNKKWYLLSKKWWNKFLEQGGKVIFFAAMLAAFLHIFIHYSGNEYLHSIEKPLTVLALSLPMIAAAFEGVRRQKEYSRNSKRSEWMLEALKGLNLKYNNLIREFKDGDDIEIKFNELLKSTDELMVHENQDWLMLMIQTDLEYVT